MIAFIFPGQGAQYVGMGKDSYESFPVAKSIFERADKALGFQLSKIIFEGPEQELVKSANCQPAILTTSIACLEVLKEKNKIIPKYTAGLSLGEYTALVAAGSFSFEDGVRLVRNRGKFMDEASRVNPGAMAAIIGLEKEVVEEFCKESCCEIANLNCPGQVVISGTRDAIKSASELALQRGARRAMPLDVSGAFHSSLMSPAQDKLNKELGKVEIKVTDIKVVSNVTAKAQESSDEIRQNLSKQLVSTTRWNDSIQFMVKNGVSEFFEIGPGTALKGLIRKINSELKVNNIGKIPEIN